jgi:hypothetical protein
VFFSLNAILFAKPSVLSCAVLQDFILTLGSGNVSSFSGKQLKVATATGRNEVATIAATNS